MKEIKAIIQPHMLNRVMQALHALPHFPGATVSDCQGYGRGEGDGGSFVATEESIFPARMARIEIFCSDMLCDELVAAIQATAHTGHPGDGIIVVADLDRVIRIGSGEAQEKAV